MTASIPPDDPDVPKLQSMLKELQGLVAEKKISPKEANTSLGMYSDALRVAVRGSRVAPPAWFGGQFRSVAESVVTQVREHMNRK